MSAQRLFAVVKLALGLGWELTQPLGKRATSTGYRPLGMTFRQLVIYTAVPRMRSFPMVLALWMDRFSATRLARVGWGLVWSAIIAAKARTRAWSGP
ncbi:MAG: hypothetical protein ACK4RZ_04240 [Paracoccaceae bacterium]